jgi:hypothetical protein
MYCVCAVVPTQLHMNSVKYQPDLGLVARDDCNPYFPAR